MTRGHLTAAGSMVNMMCGAAKIVFGLRFHRTQHRRGFFASGLRGTPNFHCAVGENITLTGTFPYRKVIFVACAKQSAAAHDCAPLAPVYDRAQY
jgi:hypothetical protein